MRAALFITTQLGMKYQSRDRPKSNVAKPVILSFVIFFIIFSTSPTGFALRYPEIFLRKRPSTLGRFQNFPVIIIRNFPSNALLDRKASVLQLLMRCFNLRNQTFHNCVMGQLTVTQEIVVCAEILPPGIVVCLINLIVPVINDFL